jgi:hypothetical protein
VIVYFSGHGVLTPRPYILTYGYSLANLPATAISGEELTGLLANISAHRLVVILDCCHAGAQVAKDGLPHTSMPFDPLLLLSRGTGRVVLASSRSDERSWAGEMYSYFTEAVLEALSGIGASELDGYTRVLDLVLHAREIVPERTQRRQHPICRVNDLSEDFAIAYYAAGDKTPCVPMDRPSVRGPRRIGGSRGAGTRSSHLRTMLRRHQRNLELIEERLSLYVNPTDVPLQLLQSLAWHQSAISDLEADLEGAGQ